MDNFEYAKKSGNSILYFMIINGDGRIAQSCFTTILVTIAILTYRL